jgi:hypothetical protein
MRFFLGVRDGVARSETQNSLGSALSHLRRMNVGEAKRKNPPDQRSGGFFLAKLQQEATCAAGATRTIVN